LQPSSASTPASSAAASLASSSSSSAAAAAQQQPWHDSQGALCIGELGIGNTSAASALLAALSGAPPAAVCGRGTGAVQRTRAPMHACVCLHVRWALVCRWGHVCRVCRT
jgi:NaMN:DMB phosphoribosyltransferase